MRTNRVLVVLSLCATISPATILHAAGTPDCTLKQLASLDLVGDPSLGLVVPVVIQDSPDYMILNTSYAYGGITKSAVRRLGLQTHSVPISVRVFAGGSEVTKVVRTTNFSVGDAKYDSGQFMVMSDNAVGPKVVGILGMNFFAHMDIEIDIANRKVNLFSPDHCPGQVVYWSKKNYDSVPIRFGELGEFYFPMELDGKKIETTLATGNATTSLSTEVTKRLYGFDASSPGIESETDASGKATSHYRAMKLSAEGLDVINASIKLLASSGPGCVLTIRSGAAAYDGCYGRHPLQLGLGVLSKLHLYIATKEKVLYFTPAVVADQPTVANP
jgi:predicted aspartyl protease